MKPLQLMMMMLSNKLMMKHQNLVESLSLTTTPDHNGMMIVLGVSGIQQKTPLKVFTFFYTVFPCGPLDFVVTSCTWNLEFILRGQKTCETKEAQVSFGSKGQLL